MRRAHVRREQHWPSALRALGDARVRDVGMPRGPETQVRRYHPIGTEFGKEPAACNLRPRFHGVTCRHVPLLLRALIARHLDTQRERLQDLTCHGPIPAGAETQSPKGLVLRQQGFAGLPGHSTQHVQQERATCAVETEGADACRIPEIAPERELRAPLSCAKAR